MPCTVSHDVNLVNNDVNLVVAKATNDVSLVLNFHVNKSNVLCTYCVVGFHSVLNEFPQCTK